MPSSRPADRFEDILENIEKIERFTAGLNRDSFLGNEQCAYAVERALLIIGEAGRKLGGLADELCPSVPWAAIRSLGNVLRHEYDGVDREQVWKIVERDLGPLKAACREALRRLQDGQR